MKIGGNKLTMIISHGSTYHPNPTDVTRSPHIIFIKGFGTPYCQV